MNSLRRLQQNLTPLFGVSVLAFLTLFYGTPPSASVGSGKEQVRVGYFPNVTHAVALVGVANHLLEQGMGRKVAVVPKVFNDGPSEMEALLAGEIDLGYVGPSPAINTFLKSRGQALTIIAGACSGGASLVARADAPIASVRDLDGKRVAIPQIGNTQDVSLRHFLEVEGLKPQEKGGSVQILPTKNPDILALFLKGELDAAWVPEPWASRLVREAKAKRVVDERDLWPGHSFATTVVVARRIYLEQHPQRVQAFLNAHVQAVNWVQSHASESQALANAEIKRLTGKALKDAVLQESWRRCDFSADPNRASLESFIQYAMNAGFIKRQTVALNDLVDSRMLTVAQQAPVVRDTASASTPTSSAR